MAELIEWGPATLRATRDLTADIRLFEIAPAAPIRAVAPGSHLSILLPIAPSSDVRSYSIVGATDDIVRIAVKLLPDSRGGSAYLWSLAPGARLTVSQPRNYFPLGRDAPDYLLVAGGIGITPIHGMALALVEAGLAGAPALRCPLARGCRARRGVAGCVGRPTGGVGRVPR